MGQVALGFRSLLIKAAVFVAMAALLAWALGGTLWPRPQVAHMPRVAFDGGHWHWQLAVGGHRGEPSWVRWTMMVDSGTGAAQPLDHRHWLDVAGPVVNGDALVYAGRAETDASSPWRIERIDADGVVTSYTMPDRLAVEQQLARFAQGLELQDQETIVQQRPAVLDPT